MLYEQPRDVWHARERAALVYPHMAFTQDGLVLGAGTVILEAETPRQPRSLQGQEACLLALLSAFYGRPAELSVLANIKRAAKARGDGDICLAYIHLAHAGFTPPDDLRSAARWLSMAQGALRHGASAFAVFKALHLDARYVAEIAKRYNPDQPRVPAGSGRTSGQWIRLLSWIGQLNVAQIARLGVFMSRFAGPAGAATAAFGLLFIPSPNNLRIEGEVPEIKGLRYAWNRDETLLRLTYDDPDGNQRTFSGQLGGDVFRDAHDRVIGRVLPGSQAVIDADAISPDLVDDDEPRLCPLPSKDGRTNDKGLDYENYIKSIVNPDNPTPPYMGYRLSNVGAGPIFDDCQHLTGTMVEIKDGYADFLDDDDWGKSFLAQKFVKQAMDQVVAAGGRPLRWYFSQEPVADYAKGVFSKIKDLQNIKVIFRSRWGEEVIKLYRRIASVGC